MALGRALLHRHPRRPRRNHVRDLGRERARAALRDVGVGGVLVALRREDVVLALVHGDLVLVVVGLVVLLANDAGCKAGDKEHRVLAARDGHRLAGERVDEERLLAALGPVAAVGGRLHGSVADLEVVGVRHAVGALGRARHPRRNGHLYFACAFIAVKLRQSCASRARRARGM